MADELPSNSTKKGAPVLAVLWWVALAVALYVLSVGPVAHYYYKNDKDLPPAVKKFYMPLELLSESFPPVTDFFIWYVQLWGVDFGQ